MDSRSRSVRFESSTTRIELLLVVKIWGDLSMNVLKSWPQNVLFQLLNKFICACIEDGFLDSRSRNGCSGQYYIVTTKIETFSICAVTICDDVLMIH